MFADKTTSYEKVEKPKQDKKFKQNSYEEIRKIVEDGGEMKLKETIKTKKTITPNIKLSLTYLVKFIIKNINYLIINI